MATKITDNIFDRIHKQGVNKMFSMHNLRKVKVYTDKFSFTVSALMSEEKNQQEKLKNNTTEEITLLIKIKEEELRNVRSDQNPSKRCIFTDITSIEIDGKKYSQTFDSKNNHTKDLIIFKLFKAKGI